MHRIRQPSQPHDEDDGYIHGDHDADVNALSYSAETAAEKLPIVAASQYTAGPVPARSPLRQAPSIEDPRTTMSPPTRRSSLGMLLRRSKSGELKGKKAQLREQELQRQRDASVPKSPPRLPVLYNGAPAPELQSFGGENPRPDSFQIVSGQHSFIDNQSLLSRPSMEPSSRSAINIPVPPIPNGAWVDPYARTESMTHRGRYSYASSAISSVNNPRRVRRRKDPTPFNILIVGTQGSGKTSFLEFLKTSLALPPKKRTKSTIDGSELTPRAAASGNFVPHYLETEIDGERVGLTLWDSEGFEKNVVDLQLREMSAFLESKFEDTFTEEMKVMRSPGVQDTHIHAVFLVLDPARLDRNIAAVKAAQAPGSKTQGIPARVVGSLDEDLDLQVLRTLQGKTTVIPVISKADTITTKHMDVLKRTVWDSLKKSGLDPLEALGFDDDEATPDSSRIDEEDEEPAEDDEEVASGEKSTTHEDDEIDGEVSNQDEDDGDVVGANSASPSSRASKRDSIRRSRTAEELKQDEPPFIPMSIISPDIYEPGVVGRAFPWGFADPNNEDHCDFVKLKEAVFNDWRGELREASREQWYETWRTSRLKERKLAGGGPVQTARRFVGQ
ncbi:hypothetical protein MCOR22_005709 [Pyricularia oryzae]|nr:hypothetical protein MCOR22_005709 [Pyricularia oryzae]KAI6522565.1 hypothetical protein MCOR16_007485 [Pyricularia oryzae]KAI6579308.1 hypothetical protein MCOR12_011773 [Pyricularia oryzae]